MKKQEAGVVSNIYLADIQISEGGKIIDSLRSYFDGSYRFAPQKKKTYTIQITYPGFTDTTFSVTCSKKGEINPSSVITVLRKDGMRLVGIIRSKDENFPIADATISVKNIMTQQEQRFTTDIDGYFNFRLQYETNYRVYIDKYSKGIINHYQDTTLYVSTIGFNKPVDYRLDIWLPRYRDTVKLVAPKGYEANREPLNKNLKPVVRVKAEPVTAKADNLSVGEIKKQEKKTEVKQPSPKNTIAEASLDSAAIAQEKSKRIEEWMAAQKRKTDSLAQVVVMLHQKFIEDSIQKAQATAQELARKVALEAKRRKEIADSLQTVKEEIAQKAALATKRKKEIADSLLAVKAEKERLAREAQARADSIAAAKELAHQEFVKDSIKQARIAARELAHQKELEAKRKKEIADSLQAVKEEIAQKAALAAKRKKEVADSLLAVKAEKERLAREAQARADSIAAAKELAHQEFVKDSIKQARIAARELARQKELEAKRRKEITDSLLAVKAEKERLAREAQARADSIAAAKVLARKEFVEDSIKQAQIAARELAHQKELEAKRRKEIADSLQAVKAEIARKAALAAKRKKEITDSLLAVKAEKDRLAREAQARADSIAAAKELAHQEFIKDSIKQARIAARELARQKELEAKRKKEIADSLQAVKEEIARKVALEAKREKEVADSLLAVKAEKERLAREAQARADSIAAAKELARKEFVEDSTKQAQATERELQRKANEALTASAKRANRKAKKENSSTIINNHLTEQVQPVKPEHLTASGVENKDEIPNSSYVMLPQVTPKARYKILFGKNNAKLNIYAQEGLEKAIQFMNVSPKSVIKIYGNTGPEEKNKQELLVKRTDAIISVLLSKGIDVERISVYSPDVEKLDYSPGTVGALLKQFRWTILEVSDPN